MVIMTAIVVNTCGFHERRTTAGAAGPAGVDKQPAPRGGVPSDFVTSEKKGGRG